MGPGETDAYAAKRRRLLDGFEKDARETAFWTGRDRLSDRVLSAMDRVPRERFVRPDDQDVAYVNRPQSIGHGQTISQPFIVALMTDLLALTGTERVLEVGTGSGYQTAVLSALAARVFTIERLKPLATRARRLLSEGSFANVEVRIGDGYAGWPEEASFDAIMVTAAPEQVPDALLRQLAPGGRMVIPLGAQHDRQWLSVVTKDAKGALDRRDILPVAFVPMVPGDAGGR